MLSTSRLITATVKVAVIMHYLFFFRPTLVLWSVKRGFLLSFFSNCFFSAYAETSRTTALAISFKSSNKNSMLYHPFPSKWKEGIITSPPSHDIQLYFYFTILQQSKIENLSNFSLYIIFLVKEFYKNLVYYNLNMYTVFLGFFIIDLSFICYFLRI
jgi:hypothetical protein